MRLAPTPAAAAACCAAALLAASFAGCKHLSEKRAVAGFAAALEAGDSAKLARLASPEFRDTALGDEAALADVRRLWKAGDEIEVVSVKEVAQDDRRDPDVPEKVVVIKDKFNRKISHRMIRPANKLAWASGTSGWVIDDIFVTQKGKDVTATRSVAAQVVFGSAVRDFASAWRSGSRADRLAKVTPACRKELEPLPDDVLDTLAVRMFPDADHTAPPEWTGDEEIATALLRRPDGAVLLQMRREDGEWLVDDAALDGGKNGESVPSLRKTAVAYAAAAEFLAAYKADDRRRLKTVAATRFFDETLKSADLSKIALPSAEAGRGGQLKVVGRQAELVITEEDRTVRLDLVRTDTEDKVDAATEFRVEDVAFYAADGGSQSRLSNVLLAEPLANLYVDALIARNLGGLTVMASHEFDERVWSHVTPSLLPGLPLSDVAAGGRELLSVVHKGPITEVTLMQAGRAMTVVLKDESGATRIDDLLLAVSDRPSSFKTTAAHLLPVLRFDAAVAAGDVEGVRQECSDDFNRLIWSQVRELPEAAAAARRFLAAPLAGMDLGEGLVRVRVGDPGFGGSISLIEERGRYKIHDVTVIAGPAPQDTASLKPLLRNQIANGLIVTARPSRHTPLPPVAGKSGGEDGGIMQVGFETDAGPPAANRPAEAGEPGLLTEDVADDAPPQTAAAEPDPLAPLPPESAAPFSEPLR